MSLVFAVTDWCQILCEKVSTQMSSFSIGNSNFCSCVTSGDRQTLYFMHLTYILPSPLSLQPINTTTMVPRTHHPICDHQISFNTNPLRYAVQLRRIDCYFDNLNPCSLSFGSVLPDLTIRQGRHIYYMSSSFQKWAIHTYYMLSPSRM